MKKQRKTHYVVIKGRKPGIYSSWEFCKRQVNGFKGAKFRGFTNETDAINWQNEQIYGSTDINFLYLASDESWDITPLSNSDKVFVNVRWLFKEFNLSREQENKLLDIGY